MSKSIEKALDKLTDKEKKIQEFSDLLDSLQNTQDKKKLLWREAYQNALEDRESANILFTDLMMQSTNNSTNHLQFGPLMSKYLERLSKCNDQILKLAELISKEEEKNEISVDDIFNEIGA
jgi:ABC-type Fe3+-citrate transport system substrate-binding protein